MEGYRAPLIFTAFIHSMQVVQPPGCLVRALRQLNCTPTYSNYVTYEMIEKGLTEAMRKHILEDAIDTD